MTESPNSGTGPESGGADGRPEAVAVDGAGGGPEGRRNGEGRGGRDPVIAVRDALLRNPMIFIGVVLCLWILDEFVFRGVLKWLIVPVGLGVAYFVMKRRKE